MRRKALCHSIGQRRSPDYALDGMQDFEVAEVRQAPVLDITDAQAEEGRKILVAHERSPTKTFSA